MTYAYIVCNSAADTNILKRFSPHNW